MNQKINNRSLKDTLQSYLIEALNRLALNSSIKIQIERCKNPNHGHFATNLAFTLAKSEKCSPKKIAEKIVTCFNPLASEIEKISIAGSGFINFSIKENYLNQCLIKAVDLADAYGRAADNGVRVLLEFVSANPTGPLHIGHARSAAFGTVLANLLEKAGYQVQREYFINDAGRQTDILALSTWIRYLELSSFNAIDLPKNAYQGDYIKQIAIELRQQNLLKIENLTLLKCSESWKEYQKDCAIDFAALEPEKQLDLLIKFNKNYLKQNWLTIKEFTLNSILKDIKTDLAEFGLNYQAFYKETNLVNKNQNNKKSLTELALNQLDKNGYLVKDGDSLVFKSSNFGDSKDRVVVRSNGQVTYFATDIAYHLDKLKRADILINIWGADHHGYIPRMKAALKALGKNPDRLEVLLVQFVHLIKNKKKVSMSTRSAEFISLRDLREDIGAHLKDLGKQAGNDTVRFFYVAKKLDQHMDFDWDLATSKKQDNPVIYLNYAYARIHSVIQLAKKQGALAKSNHLNLLTQPLEKKLIFSILQYPELISSAAQSRSPHQISHYLLDLVGLFHSYYANTKFIESDADLTSARIYLISAVSQVLKNGLLIFGIHPAKKM